MWSAIASGSSAEVTSAVAVAVATAGGRAGRVHTETLVAMSSLGTNTVTSTGVVGAANTGDNTLDNTYYPGT